jgi:hypothetical protein
MSLHLNPLDLVAVEFFGPSNIHEPRTRVSMARERQGVLQAAAALVVQRDGGRAERHEKGGKELRRHCHRRLGEMIAAYMAASGLERGSKEPLFQSFGGRGRGSTGKALLRRNVLIMVKRRCEAAALPSRISNHLPP